MNGLDLFSGIGGISIALEPWVNTVAYCEQDRYAQAVLLSRMSDGSIHRAPIWDDVTTLTTSVIEEEIDIIFGGFPCQDISVAGLGKGLAGERSGLFFEIIRLVKGLKPTFIFLENVPAIRTRGLLQVVSAFTEIGYDCRWTCLSAASIGAPHKRERWFLLAHPHSAALRDSDKYERSTKAISRNNGPKESVAHPTSERHGSWRESRNFSQENGRSDESLRTKFGSASTNATHLAHPHSERLEGQRQEPIRVKSKLNNTSDDSWWHIEPSVGRVVNGLPHRSHRIKCLGNSVVPQQVREAFKTLSGLNNERILYDIRTNEESRRDV